MSWNSCASSIVSTEKATQRDHGQSRFTKTPRPANAFILFRSAFTRSMRNRRIPQSSCSKVAGQIWRRMPFGTDSGDPHCQLHWFDVARMKKQEHNVLYPEYKYQPRKQPRASKRRRHYKEDGSSITSAYATIRGTRYEMYIPPSLAPPCASPVSSTGDVSLPEVKLPSTANELPFVPTLSPIREMPLPVQPIATSTHLPFQHCFLSDPSFVPTPSNDMATMLLPVELINEFGAVGQDYFLPTSDVLNPFDVALCSPDYYSPSETVTHNVSDADIVFDFIDFDAAM